MKKITTQVLILLFFSLELLAYPITVTVSLAPPYPSNLEYYIENFENLYLNVQNASALDQRFYLTFELNGIDNGFSARTIDGYKPTDPLMFIGGQTEIFSGPDLEDLDLGISWPDQLLIEGAPDDFLLNRILPEGTYNLCIKAFDWEDDTEITAECSFEFLVGYDEIGMQLYQPYDESEVPSNPESQFLIQWDPPISTDATLSTFDNDYEIRILDVTEGYTDDYELLLSDVAMLHHRVTDLTFPDYTYNSLNTDVPLEEGHTYAIVVKIQDDDVGALYDNNNWSNVNVFTYLNPADITNDEDEEEETLTENQIDCYYNCNVEVPEVTTPYAASEIEYFDIGHFRIFDVEVETALGGGQFKGTGKVDLPLMNGVNLEVTFDNVQINSEAKALTGTVKGKYTDEDISEVPTILNDVLRTTRMAAGLIGLETAADLPLGIDYPIAGNEVLVAIQDITFTPERASANFGTAFQFNSMNEEVWLSFAASDICIHPGGIGGEAIFHLEEDLNSAPENEDQLSIAFKGSDSSEAENVLDEASYVSMDCNGMKQIKLEADILIPRGFLVPEGEDGAPTEGRIKGNFSVAMDRAVDEENNVYTQNGAEGLPSEAGLHFIASVSLDSFQIKGLQGWGFSVVDAYFDASEVSNPPNMEVPADADYLQGYTADSWTGFYLKELALRLPRQYSIADTSIIAKVTDAFIEPSFSASFSVNNLFTLDEGKLDKCKLSMDNIYMDIVQGSFQEAGFSGEINIPIAGESEKLRYTALINQDPIITETDINADEDYDTYDTPMQIVLSVDLQEDMEIPFMMATATIREDSYIKGAIVPAAIGESYAEIHLGGDISIQTEDESGDGEGLDDETMETFDESGGLPINIALMDFEFTYHTRDLFSDVHFSLLGNDLTGDNSDQSSDYTGTSETSSFDQGDFGLEFNKERLVGLPLTIDKVGITNVTTGLHDFSFDIKPQIILGDGKLSLATNINFFSTLNGEQTENLGLSGFGINEISFAAGTELMGLQVQGDLAFYNNRDANDVGEKGIKGAIQVELPLGVGFMMAAEFGTKIEPGGSTDDTYNSAKNYPYWYVDGMIYFGSNAGIPITPGVGIYGLGGGVSYNMTRDPYQSDDGNNDAVDSAVSGITNMTSTESLSEPIRSDNQPTPAYNVMGLKFAAVFGTHPLPFSFNADISLEGEMTIGYGINLIAFRGSAYLMANLESRSNTPVYANMDFIYSRPNITTEPSDVSVSGGIDVFVDAGPIKGVGADNKMIGADFLAQNFGGNRGKGLYYLYVGTPDDPGGLKISFSNAKNNGSGGISATGYFMLGQGLPTTLPVPEEIESLFGNINGDDKNSLESETFSSEEERSESSIQQAEDGTGLAFGAKVTVDIDVNALGIYAALKVYLGMDMNVTHSQTRTCYDGSGGFQPGYNGWYGTGQVYTGLEGELGFRVKAFGKDHDLRLFYLAAAVMLKGGLPNPEWAEGRMGLQIEVLGGIISCSKSVQVRVGEQCIPGFDDPFGGIPLIVGSYPEDGAEDISPFAASVVECSFPIGQVVEIPAVDEYGETYTTYIKPVFKDISLTRGKNYNVNVPLKPVEWRDEDKRMLILTETNKKPNIQHRLKVSFIGYEYPSPGMTLETAEYRLKDEDGKNWKLDSLIHFDVGPITNLEEAVAYTIPFQGQQFYLQNENETGKGKIYFNQDLEKEDAFFEEDNKFTYQYLWRITSLNDPEDVEERTLLINTSLNSGSTVDNLSFSQLPTLDNNTMYASQLIRQSTPKSGSLIAGSIQTNFSLMNSDPSAADYEIESETDINLTNTPPDPGDVLSFNETELLTFYFKTSEFNNWSEKLYSVDILPNLGVQPAYSHHILNLEEGYDEYDLYGAFHTNGIPAEEADEEDETRAHKALLVIRDGITTKNGSETMQVQNDFGQNVTDHIVGFYEEYESRKLNNEPLQASWYVQGVKSAYHASDILFPSYPTTNFDYSSLSTPKNNLKNNVSHISPPIDDDQADAAWEDSLSGGTSGTSNIITIKTLDFDTESLIKEDVEILYEWGLSILDNTFYDEYFGDTRAPKWEKFGSKWLDNLNGANFDIEDNPGQYFLEFKTRKMGNNDPTLYKKQFWFDVP